MSKRGLVLLVLAFALMDAAVVVCLHQHHASCYLSWPLC